MLNFTCMMKQQLQHMLSALKSDSVKGRHQPRKWVILQSSNIPHYQFIYLFPGNFGNTFAALSLETGRWKSFHCTHLQSIHKRNKAPNIIQKDKFGIRGRGSSPVAYGRKRGNTATCVCWRQGPLMHTAPTAAGGNCTQNHLKARSSLRINSMKSSEFWSRHTCNTVQFARAFCFSTAKTETILDNFPSSRREKTSLQQPTHVQPSVWSSSIYC